MYFKKLEISGFKSFAEKTVLHFEPGITAIVGPNGCGKSNIFDSIRWCLGEQSIKSLRGAKSEDVIFNGTETALPQNMAEVSLTISNEAKILPIDYDEVTITRRLFRSGDSEYLINNNTVRLRDINELLMGTGIGAESYSLVEQGKIDLVISSKPEDRRLVFDEATGVSKYKAKKKEAMKKLEETDQNLLRVNDIITEVKRQIGSIERQASKARRYKELFDKLKDAELKFSTKEIKSIKSEMIILGEMAKQSYEEESTINNQLQSLDEKLIQQQKALQDLEHSLTTLKEEIAFLESSNLRDHQHINLNHERIIDFNKSTEHLNAQKVQLQSKITAHEKSVRELSETLMSLHEVFLKQESELKTQEEKLDTINQETEISHAAIKDLKNRDFELNVKKTKASNTASENTSAIQNLLARQRRLETERLKTSQEDSELSTNINSVYTQILNQKEKIEQINQSLLTLKQEKFVLESRLKTLEEATRNLENEKIKLRSQFDFLKELQLQYDKMPEAKNGILEVDQLPLEAISGIIAHAGQITFDENTKKHRICVELKFISFDLAHIEKRIDEVALLIQEKILQMQVDEKKLLDIVSKITLEEEEFQKERYSLTNQEAVWSNLSANSKKIQEELSLIDLELLEVAQQLETNRAGEESSKLELENIGSQIKDIEEKILQNSSLIEAHAQTKESLLVEITQLRTEISGQKEKEESVQGNLSFFQNALQQDTESLSVHDQEITSNQSKSSELEKEIEDLDQKIRRSEEEIDSKTKEFNRLSQIRTEEINGLDFIQKQLIDFEEKLDKIKEDNHRYQMQEQELNFKHSNIKNRILQSYSVDLEQTPASEEALEFIDMDQLAIEISALKEKVESFGTVNLVAIEELEELKNRYEFLTQQQNDLFLGKDSLQKAIQKINRTTRKMFLETFQIVAEEFKNYFKLLFGGGEAKLFLLDEEDVLESGIEIICRPPGKKLQNITLLSGGEKSLSAIALIFAIFKTKPSPFCVLDEIDAALDESNIDRFSRMLSDFSKTSQFITITHNKKTISRANVMYGITMERSGMSKIVSVKLHENAAGNPSFNDSHPETHETPVSISLQNTDDSTIRPA